jgi:hypothetical protein
MTMDERLLVLRDKVITQAYAVAHCEDDLEDAVIRLRQACDGLDRALAQRLGLGDAGHDSRVGEQ